MKRTLLALFIAALSFTFAACDNKEETKPEEIIPVHAVKVPVTSASAVCDGAKADGVIDNEAKTIAFTFTDGTIDLSKVTVTVVFNEKATPKNFSEPTVCDFSDGKTATLTVNDKVDDINYTLSATKPTVAAVAEPVLSAYALTKNGARIDGVVDNGFTSIDFYFIPVEVTINDIEVVIDYDPQVKLKDKAFEGARIDLSKPYEMVINDGVNDLTYTITGHLVEATRVDYEQCSVICGIPGEAPAADPEHIADGKYANYPSWDTGKTSLLNGAENLFDNLWMSKAEAYTEVEYHFCGQGFVTEEFSTWFVFDIGENLKVEHIQIMPYYPYTEGQCCREFEFYAFIGSGEPCALGTKDGSGNIVVDTANWQLVSKNDITSWYDIQKMVKADKDNLYGTDEDLCVKGYSAEFVEDAPAARYYCYNQISNMFSYGKEEIVQWWTGRVRAITISEFLVYAYQAQED